jgi:2-polyprenyl-6-methoxyphenol hydroxylase-like FAD-dependent oxidoreductase
MVSKVGMADEYDVITIGGGLAGAALAKRLAENGVRVLVLEREVAFRDRVRGEQMHCWGVAEARALGLYTLLLETCGREVRYWSSQLVGFAEARRRDLVQTSPHGAGSLNFYHPDMQSVVIGAAASVGATVRRGARVVEIVPGESPGVRIQENEKGQYACRARLLVGADGRNSVSRRWGGFRTQRDPDGMIIAGLLMEGLQAPDDQVSLFVNPRRSMFSLTVPLGAGRFRAYVGIHKDARASTARPLSGQGNTTAFLELSIAAGAPAKWYENGARTAGPLASYDATDTWVSHPHRAGIVLIGDAAASNDPSFGCGLSLTLRDVRVLADKLLASADWLGAADAYAEEHDRHYNAIHRLTGWARRLFYDPSPAAAAVRETALTRLAADRTRSLDITGTGPDCPCDETTRKRFFGED